MIATPVRCVVDPSVGIKLVVQEVLTAEAHSLFRHLATDPGAQFFAPDLFDVECANILWKHTQRHGTTPSVAEAALRNLQALAIQKTPTSSLCAEALAIAVQFGITAYDACYVAAAARHSAPLITADSRLANRMAGSSHAVFDLATVAVPAAP